MTKSGLAFMLMILQIKSIFLGKPCEPLPVGRWHMAGPTRKDFPGLLDGDMFVVPMKPIASVIEKFDNLVSLIKPSSKHQTKGKQ